MRYFFEQLYNSLVGQPYDGVAWHNVFWYQSLLFATLWFRADSRYRRLVAIVVAMLGALEKR